MSERTLGATVIDMTDAPKGKQQGLSSEDFQRIAWEIQQQPDFRQHQDKCADYYDGNQTDAETMAELQSRGLSDITDNLIQPVIDVVLGTEAKMRRDTRVTADGDDVQDVAEALNKKLHEAERETRADTACSDAYKSMMISGVGWTEVSRQSDPFKYPYRVCSVHRREMFWDWTARENDLSDARYFLRRRWFPADQVKTFYPQHKRLIEAAGAGWDDGVLLRLHQETADLQAAYDQEERITLNDWLWREIDANMVCLYELYTKQFVRGFVMQLPNGKAVEFNLKDPRHREMAAMGVQPFRAVYAKWVKSIWLGPHKLDESPVEDVPYTPWWCYREDLTGVPYGLVRGMLSAQDEINARARKLAWALSARRLYADSDALDLRFNDHNDVLAELARPDAAIITDPNRRRDNGVRVDDNIGMSEQQMKVLNDRRETLQRIRGIYNAMMGDESGATSGIAINSLVEQSMTVLAEPNANAEYARTATMNKLLDLIQEDIGTNPVQVIVGDPKRGKVIVLNKPVQDEMGNVTLENDVQAADVKVGLEDVPQTSAYRAQQLQMLTEVVRAMPPDAQSLIAPYYLEATDLPDRKEMATLMRQRLGIPSPEEMNNGPDPQQQAMQEQQQQMQMEMQQLGMAKMQAEVQKLQAEAAKVAMEAQQPPQDDGMERYHQQMQDKVDSLQEQLLKMDLALKNKEAEISARLEQERMRIEGKLASDAIKIEAQREIEELRSKIGVMETVLSKFATVKEAEEDEEESP